MREGWEYKRLGELCDIVMGQSPMGNSINENNGIEFHQGKTNFGDKFLMESGIYTTSPIRIAEKKTILLCVRAPVGIINITERQVCIGRGLSSLKPRLGLELLYLYYCLLSKQNYFESNSTGSTFKAISSKVINNTIIQFPPKPTQLSIVSELDKLNELIRIKKEQLKDYDTLAQSIFYEMFGDPVENEKGWEVKKFGDLFKLKSGDGLSSKDFKTGIYPVYGGNGISGYHNSFNMKGCYIIIGRVGVYCGNVRKVDGEFWLTDNAFRLIYKENEQNPFFILYLLNILDLHQYANAAAQPVISNLTLKSIDVPLPPLSLQQSFAHKIEQIERQKAEVQKTITDLETLLAARMQYWFD